MSTAIKKLQELLNSVLHPSPKLKLDGILGRKTIAALELYNKIKEKLSASGNAKPMVAHHASVPTATPASSSLASSLSTTSLKWMSIALGEVGQASIAGFDSNARILEYLREVNLANAGDEVAWCSAFVNWVMNKAGYVGTKNALASSWAGWGRSSEPVVGAIVIVYPKGATFEAGKPGAHVGFYCGTRDEKIRILGGNQFLNANDVGRVNEMGHPLSAWTVQGYRWPT